VNPYPAVAVQPPTLELLQHLERNRAVLRQALEEAPPELRERRPAPDRWSVAEVLEHLAIVERQISKLLDRGLRTALASGPLPAGSDASPVLPTIDAQRLLDRGRRLEAGERVRPSQGLTAAAAWLLLQETRASLQGVLLAGDGLRTDAITAPHPSLGALTFHQWFAFVGFHEARHAAQIRATAATLGGRDAGDGTCP
jgi:hypothetical protein